MIVARHAYCITVPCPRVCRMRMEPVMFQVPFTPHSTRLRIGNEGLHTLHTSFGVGCSVEDMTFRQMYQYTGHLVRYTEQTIHKSSSGNTFTIRVHILLYLTALRKLILSESCLTPHQQSDSDTNGNSYGICIQM